MVIILSISELAKKYVPYTRDKSDKKVETIKESLERIAVSDTSDRRDNDIVQYVLRAMGNTEAIVTCGIVYLYGNSKNNEPFSIHDMAENILRVIDIVRKDIPESVRVTHNLD
jgi:hypothetical protein